MRTSPGRFLTAGICLIGTERVNLLIRADTSMITFFDRNIVITFSFNTIKVLISNYRFIYFLYRFIFNRFIQYSISLINVAAYILTSCCIICSEAKNVFRDSSKI